MRLEDYGRLSDLKTADGAVRLVDFMPVREAA
jgi:hypothetical protein